MSKSEKIYINHEKVKQAEKYISQNVKDIPLVAVTLGSGLGDFVDRIDKSFVLSSRDIPNYPDPSVQGHGGRLIFGTIGEVPVLGIQGRSHYYEGRSLEEVVFYIDLIHKLGVEYLILTNAAGGVDIKLKPGDLVLLDSYLNFTQIEKSYLDNKKNPISKDFFKIAGQVAEKLDIKLYKGKYCWTTGPSFETWEEVKVCRELGVAVVGMSTVPELQRSAALGLETIGISLVTNMAAGIDGTELSHEEVQETADRAKAKYSDLISGIIGTIKKIES